MKTNYCLLSVLLIVPYSLFSQHYRMAAGVRMGTEFGVSLQTKVVEHLTIETILNSSLSKNRQSVAFILEEHKSLLTNRLNYYIGAGPHQSWTRDSVTNLPGGITAIMGAELTLGRYNISWDYRPSISLWGKEPHKFTGETAITLRYIFWKDPKKKVNWKFWEKKK